MLVCALQKFQGRKRNCYGIGMRYVHKALKYATLARQQKKKDMREVSIQYIQQFHCKYRGRARQKSSLAAAKPEELHIFIFAFNMRMGTLSILGVIANLHLLDVRTTKLLEP